MRRWFREVWTELRARSAGRKAMGNDKSTFKAARGIVGITGASFSNAWDFLERDGGAYLRSLEKEPMLPPSLFISERDRTRYGAPMPLVERCIEDHGDPDALLAGDWDTSELDG
ncbi:MAG: hypothetical protein ACI81L_001897 [Verrucomicrobiales bacterium]|jgi:hypothetical protein